MDANNLNFYKNQLRKAQEELAEMREIREQLEAKLKLITDDRDCWISNARILQGSYNELDKKMRDFVDK